MTKLTVSARGPGGYTVEVCVDGDTTRHDVIVSDELRAALGLATDGSADERLIRESFAFLLEREPATSILARFRLDVIGRYFPDYLAEIRSRLG